MQTQILKALIAGGMLVIMNLCAHAQSWSLNGNAGTTSTNFLGTTDGQDFRIKTNGTARMTVKSNGKVGIGITSPVAKLQVSSSTASPVGLSADGLFVIGDKAGNNIAFDAQDIQARNNSAGATLYQNFYGGDVQLGPGTNPLIYKASTGNVGIGVFLPNEKLAVKSSNNLSATNIASFMSNDATKGIGIGQNTIKTIGSSTSDLNLNASATNGSVVIQNSPLVIETFLKIGNFRIAYDTVSPFSLPGGNCPALAITDFNTGARVISTCPDCTKVFGNHFEALGGNILSENSPGKGFGELGINTAILQNILDVNGPTNDDINIASFKVNRLGTVDIKAIESYSKPADGYGYGLFATGGFVGGRLVSEGGSNTGTTYGVFATATGTTGTRIGVYGSATGGSQNWGGYFPAKTYTSELRVGTTNGATGYIVCVGGKLIAEEVRVELLGNWPDDVFDNDHSLMSIDDLERHVKAYKHLPGIPSACEIEENGIMLGSMQTKMMEKIEESTLYIIQLKKENDVLKNKLDKLQSQVDTLLNR